MAARLPKIVLTGAAGRLGKVLRPGLRALCETLVLSDRLAPDPGACDNEQFQHCNLADHAAVGALLRQASAIVHFGGLAHEAPFDALLDANLRGPFNLFDQALAQGVRRIVLASSSHVTGFYPAHEAITPEAPPRPDSLYGVSKAYAETLARFYHDRHGIETVCLRIGSCLPEPRSPRCLSAWLSHRDLAALVRCALLAPNPGFAIVWGISANRQICWQGDDAARIGYQPQDSAEDWRARIESTAAHYPGSARLKWQGGSMVGRDYRQPDSLFPRPAPRLCEQAGEESND